MIKDKDGFWFIEDSDDIYNLICPLCGNKLSFNLVGEVTMNQIMEDMEKCHLIECVDENDCNLGYHIICKKDV